MLQIALIHPGATEYDQQGRIQGTLDIPLTDEGRVQADQAAGAMANLDLAMVYSAPNESAQATAEVIAGRLEVKLKALDQLKNLDLGLWQGLQVEEVRAKQPKVYRQWQETPDAICPPEGETLPQARKRIGQALTKIRRKHKEGVVGLVVPEPLLSLVRSALTDEAVGNLWKAVECGSWELIPVAEKVPVRK